MFPKSAEWSTSIILFYLRWTRRILPQQNKMQQMADFIDVVWPVPIHGPKNTNKKNEIIEEKFHKNTVFYS